MLASIAVTCSAPIAACVQATTSSLVSWSNGIKFVISSMLRTCVPIFVAEYSLPSSVVVPVTIQCTLYTTSSFPASST